MRSHNKPQHGDEVKLEVRIKGYGSDGVLTAERKEGAEVSLIQTSKTERNNLEEGRWYRLRDARVYRPEKDPRHRYGELRDIAPTLLSLLGIEKPDEMTGESLIT